MTVNFFEYKLILIKSFPILISPSKIHRGLINRIFCKLNCLFFITPGGAIVELTNRQNIAKTYSLAMVKSFLIWTFTLGVCLLVVGFPLIVLMVTVGSLLALALQSVLSVSAVLLVAGTLIGINVLAVVVCAAILALKGVHPDEVRWLNWLHGGPDPLYKSIYAACPLTCDLTK